MQPSISRQQALFARFRRWTTAVARRWPLLLGAVVYKLAEDRLLPEINDYLEDRSGVAVSVLQFLFDNLTFVTWLIIPLAVLGIVVHAYSDTRGDDEAVALSNDCKGISQSLFSFLGNRKRTEPIMATSAMSDPQARDAQMAQYSRHMDETMILFQTKFSGKVLWLLDQLAHRGYSDPMIGPHIINWNNPHGIREVAVFLAKCGEALNPSPAGRSIDGQGTES